LVRLKGFQKLTPVDQALRLFLKAAPTGKLNAETMVLSSALNRVLAEDVIADENLPRFNKSAVDGYAVRTEDTVDASQFKPKTFALARGDSVGRKQAVQVSTGNPMPEGSDAVAMLENVKRVEDGIEVWVALTPGANVSMKGEDVLKGKTVLEPGTRLGPYHLALIGALGRTKVKVYGRPVVSVLATGNELAKMGRKLQPNQIFDTNSLMISSMCLELGAEPLDLGIARDDVEVIGCRLKEGLRRADAVITTGGTSVGEADLVPEVVGRMGKPGVVAHGVAMRPGMPTALAVVDGKPVVILSGNPVAAVVGFEFFARPLICRRLGLKGTELRPVVKARLTNRVTSALGRRTFVRVCVRGESGESFARPVSARGSGAISTLTEANGYVVVAENREGLEEGEMVSVSLFSSVVEAKVSV
jgi:molybdopterin molybdotransferase